MNAQQMDLPFKRQPDGQYVGRHGFWVYVVSRDPLAMAGRQWSLETYPEGNPEGGHKRTGLSSAMIAKAGALHTRCIICGRSRAFGELEPHQRDSDRRNMVRTWRCRDRESCATELAAAAEQSRADIQAQRDTDHDDIYIQEDEYGPQLVLVRGRDRHVIDVTDNDLDKIQGLVHSRDQDKLWECATSATDPVD